ncbi:MAG: metal-dependent transcriptional regulator, partial [Candidatus Magnetoovum sp. WYHC-5]|nr:metal-dependent transcriptional regulator [Candidatus Magnetoovum sp. WYHC-5]
ELQRKGYVDIYDNNERITLTDTGMEYAKRIIRAHRLAERLLYDVIGTNIEKGACEFEHTVTPELVDSICILLGHPRECPHGLPIPSGDCCMNAEKVVKSSVKHLHEMDIGQEARIAYINCSNDVQLHRLNGLQVRPGVVVRLHQKYPSFVIECDGSSIAIDETIADNICVWTTNLQDGGKVKRTRSRHKSGLLTSLFNCRKR